MGPASDIKTMFQVRDYIYRVKTVVRPWDRFIVIMGICVLVRRYPLIAMAKRPRVRSQQCCLTDTNPTCICCTPEISIGGTDNEIFRCVLPIRLAFVKWNVHVGCLFRNDSFKWLTSLVAMDHRFTRYTFLNKPTKKLESGCNCNVRCRESTTIVLYFDSCWHNI